jgi:hypothetical protein
MRLRAKLRNVLFGLGLVFLSLNILCNFPLDFAMKVANANPFISDRW